MTALPTPRPLIALVAEALARRRDRRALVTPDRGGGADRVLTSGDVLAQAARVADALHELGVRRGEPVLLLSENRERWLLCDLALLALGSPDVPRGAEAPADEVAYIAEKVGARVAIVERPELLGRIAGAARIEVTVLLTGTAPRALSFEELLAKARPGAEERFAARVAERSADEVASIVFTSGTTGRPKGVVLTQANLAANLTQVLAVIGYLHEGGTLLSILPPWHMFERMVEYALLTLGLSIVYSDRRHFGKDFAARAPAVVGAVPRLWMMILEGVRAKVAAAPPRKRRLVEFALELGARRARRRRFPGTPFSLRDALLAPVDGLLRKVVLSKIVHALGAQRLSEGLAISGGGTLPDHVDLFFASLGIDLTNGWGLTETAPVLTLRTPGHNVGGTVGQPLAGTEVVARDAETSAPLAAGRRGILHARGPQVMRGYLDDPAATAAVLSPDGWFNTGDLGHVTADGDVVITGRAKDTIVLLSGENVEPEPIENALTSSPLIEQAVVVGQDEKHLAALIVPRGAGGAGEPAASAPVERAARLRLEIDECVCVRKGFRAHERIVRFRVLEAPLTVESGLLSQTLKVKRAVVQERFAAEIRALFDGPAADER
ncbi:MAG TPA: AMP-binding protein [Planctomycetota bacterium]|jgi:long-chain acyl-CoA synthetase|nr:AMP-binding protein [Planctomycetota bacterium]